MFSMLRIFADNIMELMNNMVINNRFSKKNLRIIPIPQGTRILQEL